MYMNIGSDPLFANLSLTDPGCIRAAEKCDAFYAAENASQAALPWADLFVYGHWATWYYIVIIGLLFLLHIFRTAQDHKSKRRFQTNQHAKPSLMDKLRALGRFVLYRQVPRNTAFSILDLPRNIGGMLFFLLTLVFLLGLTFAARPYYREHLGYGSPPIAIRTDAMAVACTPILVALAGKANIVTLFTGISHEKLNVVHRWVAWMTFGLSLVHAIPYFVASYRDWGWGGFERVKHEFYAYGTTGPSEYGGVPPLAILFALCVSSHSSIRHRFYESFYAVHILLAITYLGLMFWHAGNLEDTWAYLWATLALWLASWFARMFWKTQPLKIHNTWFQGAPATVSACPEDVIRIDVWPEHAFSWTPGQHVFLRFMGIAPLDNHPFTIASAAPQDSAVARPHLVFLARSHAGFTQKLALHVQRSTDKEGGITSPVWIDGPYGGFPYALQNRYDSLLLLAGGTGITSVLPWLLDTARRPLGPTQSLRRITLVWAIRNSACLSWLEDELRLVTGQASDKLIMDIIVHITGQESADLSTDKPVSKLALTETTEDVIADSEQPRKMSLGHRFESGRPVMSAVVASCINSGERTMVMACGPRNFNVDAADAVAAAQRRVANGDCVEIALHTDNFGW